MQEPPMIDVQPPESKFGCLGCLGKLIPISIFGLLLLSGAGWLAYGVWSAEDPKRKEAREAAKKAEVTTQAAHQEKGAAEQKVQTVSEGEAGVEPTTQATGVEEKVPVDSQAAKVMIAQYDKELEIQGVPPEERMKLIQKKFGHQAGRATAPAQVVSEAATRPQGVTKGSPPPSQRPKTLNVADDGGNTGAVEFKPAVGQNRSFMKTRGTLQTVGSDLTYEIIFQESGGQLHYRFFLMSYEAQIDKLFKKGESYLTLRFLNEAGEMIIPATAAHKIPLQEMVAYEQGGKPAGWVLRGIISAEGVDTKLVKEARVGWSLSPELSGWLKELKKIRSR